MNKAILLLPLLLLAGCTTESLLSKQVASANAACAPYGGVNTYYTEHYNNRYSATCVDNTYIQGYVK